VRDASCDSPGWASQVVKACAKWRPNHKLRGQRQEPSVMWPPYYYRRPLGMRYDFYLQNGYPIASGSVEGGLQELVKDRMDGVRNALGHRPMAEAVLQLAGRLPLRPTSEDYWRYHVDADRSVFPVREVASARCQNVAHTLLIDVVLVFPRHGQFLFPGLQVRHRNGRRPWSIPGSWFACRKRSFRRIDNPLTKENPTPSCADLLPVTRSPMNQIGLLLFVALGGPAFLHQQRRRLVEHRRVLPFPPGNEGQFHQSGLAGRDPFGDSDHSRRVGVFEACGYQRDFRAHEPGQAPSHIPRPCR